MYVILEGRVRVLRGGGPQHVIHAEGRAARTGRRQWRPALLAACASIGITCTSPFIAIALLASLSKRA
jgi:hypothetical protein